MRLFKKSKKSPQPSQQSISLLVPTQIAAGALGASAGVDENAGPGGAFRSVGIAKLIDIDLTIAPGENSGRSSRTSLRDISEDQRPRPSGASTSTRQREGSITRRCTLLQPMRPMPMTLIAANELCESEAPSNAPNEELCNIAPNLSTPVWGPRVQDQEVPIDRGAAASQSSSAPTEDMPEAVGKDAHEIAHSGGWPE